MEHNTYADGKRYYSLDSYFKNRYGSKVFKVSLNAGFTCPNIDGTKGFGGCTYCSSSGSGDFAGNPSESLETQFKNIVEVMHRKWKNVSLYMPYFQAHTNTYAPVSELREKFYAALDYGKELPEGERPEIIGIAIATRPDCLNDEIYELLAEINEKTFMWVELGLQSSNPVTGETINRCHPVSDHDEACRRLAELGIRTVVHMIFGLPKTLIPAEYDADGNLIKDAVIVPETREEMLETVRHACAPVGYNKTTGSDRIFGIKLHMLNIVKGSQMERLCPNYVPFQSIEEYADLAVDAVKIIPREITVHRLSADAPRKILIAPEWSYMKRTILNTIHQKLAEQDIWQGQDAE